MKISANHIKPPERELLLRLQKGDEEAFTELFYAYKDKLYGFILGITHSEEKAEDVVQDVFLKIWQNRAKTSTIENLNAFIFRMAHNQAIDCLRRFSKESVALTELSVTNEGIVTKDPAGQLIDKEIRHKIAEAIRQLPPQQQKVYILHKEHGFRHEEIAQKLNLSVSTIQNHMGQAMGNIRRFLSYTYPEIFSFLLLLGSGIFLKK